MFEKFTDTSRKAVAIANQRTHQLGGNVIGDVELLLGIADLPACNGACILRKLGVKLKPLRAILKKQSRPLDDGSAPEKLPQSREFKLAVEAAIASSAEAAHGWVGTEHMLLGILRYPATKSSQVLAAAGISVDEIVRAALTPAPSSREP